MLEFYAIDLTGSFAAFANDRGPCPALPTFWLRRRQIKISTLPMGWRRPSFLNLSVSASVADRIPDPDFYPSRIPDAKTATKERGGKKWCHTLFCSHKFHKTENYFVFELVKKKIWANFQRIIELFMQKIVIKLSKIWFWDLRSGIRKKPIPDPGSRIQGSKRHRIPDPDPQHW
jgi:hypothetical protein